MRGSEGVVGRQQIGTQLFDLFCRFDSSNSARHSRDNICPLRALGLNLIFRVDLHSTPIETWTLAEEIFWLSKVSRRQRSRSPPPLPFCPATVLEWSRWCWLCTRKGLAINPPAHPNNDPKRRNSVQGRVLQGEHSTGHPRHQLLVHFPTEKPPCPILSTKLWSNPRNNKKPSSIRIKGFSVLTFEGLLDYASNYLKSKWPTPRNLLQ